MDFGVTIVCPGKVGKEYFLTRGHYHAKAGKGDGMMLLQTRTGESKWFPLTRGRVGYVPPFWAYRTANTGRKKLYIYFVYPSDSGHDYDVFKQKGCSKLVVEERESPKIVDNPSFK